MQLVKDMNNNKLIIAAAGSGKTRTLVREALKITDKNILITTFTEANKAGIKKKIIKETGSCIPQNITVQTWYSFLLQHGVRPFQGSMSDDLWDKKIGFFQQSGTSAMYTSETEDFLKHYFTKDLKIYSDKISKFVIKLNEKANEDIIKRISIIYPNIFIDEVQDLAGYDLEILKLLFNSKSNILLVGDPRQGTYSTHNSRKNKKFEKSLIIDFFEENKNKYKIYLDNTSLTINYRSNQKICDFSNKLFPNQKPASSGQKTKVGNGGVFLVRAKDADDFLTENNKCTQLRWDTKKKVNNDYPVMNYGESKGLDFGNILIYPTKPIENWIKDNNNDLSPTSRCKFYVAITRARYNVGIVYNFKNDEDFEGIIKWKGNV
jgi:DNA helicase-2/ATP-dependent DNA helicase PcrA